MAARKSLVVSATSASVIAVLVATVAIVSGGYTAQRMDLNDGSVWVANGGEHVIGRANTQVLALDTVVPSTGTEIDVVQRGANVLLVDRTDSKIDVVDPATSQVRDSVPLPPQDPEVFLTEASVVIVARGTGQVWVMPEADVVHFDQQSPPTLSLGKDAVVSVSPDGVLIGYSSQARRVYRLDLGAPGSTPATFQAGLGDSNAAVTVTSVGNHWALLDATSRRLSLDGRLFDLSSLIGGGSSPVLQQPSSGGDRVYVAFDGGLVSLPVSGGTPRAQVTGESGFPAAPVTLNGCTYAAWSGGSAWRSCAGESEPQLQRLDSMPPAAVRLTFARNGDKVLLNDPRGGGSWAVQADGHLIDNWSELIVTKDDQQQVEENNLDTPPELAKDQMPPVAVNDTLGARPGVSSILPVLLNDYDPNGDVLVISDVTPIDAAQGRIDLVNNRQQLQLTTTPGAHGAFGFRYTIDDGRGGSATAAVTVTVRSPLENSPPEQVRQTSMLVAQGGRATVSALGDWIDPDGDAFYLVSATTAPPDTVSYRPEGSVVFVDGGASAEQRSVSLVVSDGQDSASGSIRVSVKKPGEVPIVADPFVVLAYAGAPVTIHPLDHVRGGSGVLRLTSVPVKSGSSITASLEKGTFTFTSDQIRTHYLDFVVNDGDNTATGVIRVDVAAPPNANSTPITLPKTIFVKTLSSQTIDVASTDIDPAGGVLLVTGVYNVPGTAPVRADVLEQKAIRVTLTGPLSGPVTFNYRISNGLAEAEGVVRVIETPIPARLQPPIATDDAVTVRVGDAVDIPVLDNDVQPDGEDLSLNPQLSTTLTGDSGLLFASGDVLRYLAPDKPGNFTATYEVSGPDGQRAQANVRIAVREPNDATNNPPVPAAVTARVLSGATVRIPIPLTGIDPDGDSVQLLGQESNPQKGAVTTVGDDYFDYEAGGYSAGTDTFTYTVLDALGARAIGTVRVGISAKLDGARNPVALEDEVTVRPGSTVSVRVLSNDSDPDGSPLSVVGVVPNDPTVTAEVVGDMVRVTPPRIPGRYGLVYTIANDSGGTGSNFVTVIVDPDAPPVYPVARDTVLTLTDILDRDTIDVDVLRNVFLADGPVSSLTVALLPGRDADAQVTADRRIRVTVGNQRQIIPFQVSRPGDGAVAAYAFVWVPGYDDALPQLNHKARALSVPSESALTIDLNDYVVAIGGKKVRLADTSGVRATHSNGQNPVVDDHTLRFTSADKYFGPASVSFQVTDGASADDPNGRVATLVLPIKVTPRENQPPVFNGGVIDFEPGESKVLDLLKLTTYPYPKDVDELAYSVLGQAPAGFSYTLRDQKLTLHADSDAVKNTTSTIVLGVRDDIAEGKSGTIQLGLVPSTRPLARPAADVAVTPRGTTTIVDVLANDDAGNPFPGQPLKVVAIRGIDGDALPAGVSIAPSADNRRLAVTVAKTAQPVNVNLQYQVADATADADRYVWGAVTLQIQDVPEPVTGVAVTSFSDRSVTVAFSPGGFNNSPISGYEVTATRTDGTVFSVTPCPITSGCAVRTPGNGPDNGVRISVTAQNAIGTSEPTAIGSTVWSDLLPAAPSISDAKATNVAPGAVSISWPAVAAPAGGSAITDYIVRIVGPDWDSSSAVAATGASQYTFTPTLVAGRQYQVSLYAKNSAQVLSSNDWNRSATATVTAVGPPSAVSALSAVVANARGDVAVTWGGSDPNGAPTNSVTYTVGRFTVGDTAPTACRSASPGSGGPVVSGWTDTSVSDGGHYFYVVYADNGYFCTPTVSGSVVTKATPGQTSGTVTVARNGTTGQFDIRVDALTSAGPKYPDTVFQYRLGSGAWTTLVSGTWITSMADSSVYGNPITVTLRACRDAVGGFCGESSAPTTLTPVNTRAGITSCAAGSDVIPTPPVNAGAPTVTYRYSFQNELGIWVAASDATPPAGTTAVRVTATVEIGPAPYYTDPAYGEGPCTP
ncbi:Ig-like domain-containing protein [Parafrigoribacterium mesophilum]|uniref:Ig-like domain-containing protein n=1 Tax=Parafrigoribacterium mesophilum TaxID=433646 RepID=UPI0031FD658A